MSRPKGGKNNEWSKEQKYKIIQLVLSGEKSARQIERETGIRTE